ncbi:MULTISPECIES: glycosyltransferase family 25 protein [unclassified Agarivorans]|uniref:glycosyltransferase family 25 protein n=1 Tax=unclassified Agarivorans TaxID=2636026 RepID=UPI0026E431CC|nr:MULTISPECIES: glycosyltransferase family 25 protein [unclassified Agarivorans]MDO6686755.1 glycosyltransferase family 25 protein [Agarivorans sp. 3_MG-2023]MDO6716515.1 glycosyltransferase family 25 protein [Agarivorans sp. 2_MG-2023]
MKIFVISLKRSVVRREEISLRLNELGLDFEIFDAVDGSEHQHPLFKHFDQETALWRSGIGINNGELGCFASHFSLWLQCIEMNEPIIVLEDDAVLPDDFASWLPEFSKLIPRYEFLKIGRGLRLRSLWVAGKYITEQQVGERHIVKYMRHSECAHAYVLSPTAAKRFVENGQTWLWPVDDYMEKEHLSKVLQYGLEPPLVVQRMKDSEIFKTGGTEARSKRNLVMKIRREYFRYKDRWGCNFVNYCYWLKAKFN